MACMPSHAGNGHYLHLIIVYIHFNMDGEKLGEFCPNIALRPHYLIYVYIKETNQDLSGACMARKYGHIYVWPYS